MILLSPRWLVFQLHAWMTRASVQTITCSSNLHRHTAMTGCKRHINGIECILLSSSFKVRGMVFNATFNNISVILWRPEVLDNIRTF
jgi:hypothetical protein